MSQRLFIGNLALDVTDVELRDVFAKYGVVLRAEVVRARGGRSRRFGYVELDSPDSAARATTALNGSELQGQEITVASARAHRPRSPGEEDASRGWFGGGEHRGGRR